MFVWLLIYVYREWLKDEYEHNCNDVTQKLHDGFDYYRQITASTAKHAEKKQN